VISEELNRRSHELSSRGEPFVTATVVRVQRPTSVQPGNVAIVRGDGTIEGFIGGVCAQHSVRLYSLQVIASGEPLLLRIDPDGPPAEETAAEIDPQAGAEIARGDGVVTVLNPCLSGGAIEMFLEPFLPAPRVVVAGDSPIVTALERLGPELGLELVGPGTVSGNERPRPVAGDLALVVAAHGREELESLRAGVAAAVPYVGLVASRKRGAAVLDELRQDGMSDADVARIESPAGLDLGARTPPEIALSILARIVEVRRARDAHVGALGDAAAAPAPPRTAVDPICGMTLVVVDDTPSLQHDGETIWFCCEGCRQTYEKSAA
jgi:xanthine dehydrogenase accessory factor